jgi:hypothetical protein
MVRLFRWTGGSILVALGLLIFNGAAQAQTASAGDPRFERFRLASVPLPGTVDEVVVDEAQALEVFLSPSDFPDALVRLTLEGATADFAMNLDFSSLTGEALPERVQWPSLGERALEVRAPSSAHKGIRLAPSTPPRPEEAEALAGQELRLEWFLRPEEGDAGGALRGRVHALRLVSTADEGVTLASWIADPEPSGCAPATPERGPRCHARGVSRTVTSISVDPSGRWLAVSGGDLRPRVDIWNLATFELLRRVTFPPWQGPPFGAELTADGRFLVVGDAAGVVHLWDAATGGGHRSIDAHAQAFEVIEAGRSVAVSSDRGELTLWRLRDETIALRLRQATGVSSVQLVASRDGARLAELNVEAGAAQVIVWDLEERSVIGRIGGIESGLVDLVLDGAGANALTTHDERGLHRAEVTSPSQWREWGGAPGRGCRGRMAVSPDGALLACALEGGAALFELSTGRLVRRLEQMSVEGELVGLVFSPDSERLIAVGGGELLAWDIGEVGP